MMIEPVGAASVAAPQMVSRPSSPAVDFGQMLGEGIARLDTDLKIADQQLRAMAAGGDVPVHDVMLSMESARMNLALMVEVRNRAVEAYQELMRMQL